MIVSRTRPEALPTEAFFSAVQDGHPVTWRHLNEMERGIHGSFAQRIRAAMEVADQRNQRKLYETFTYEFTPRW